MTGMQDLRIAPQVATGARVTRSQRRALEHTQGRWSAGRGRRIVCWFGLSCLGSGCLVPQAALAQLSPPTTRIEATEIPAPTQAAVPSPAVPTSDPGPARQGTDSAPSPPGSALVRLLDMPLPLPPGESRDAASRHHVQLATRYFSEGAYVQTANECIAAYRLQPAPLLLFNAAQALRKASRWLDAVALYERYLSQAPPPNMAAEAQAHIASARAQMRVQAINEQLSSAEAQARRQGEAAERLARENERSQQENRELRILVRERRPVYQRPWFWVVLGGSTAAVGGLAIGLAIALQPEVPKGTLGSIQGGFPP